MKSHYKKHFAKINKISSLTSLLKSESIEDQSPQEKNIILLNSSLTSQGMSSCSNSVGNLDGAETLHETPKNGYTMNFKDDNFNFLTSKNLFMVNLKLPNEDADGILPMPIQENLDINDRDYNNFNNFNNFNSSSNNPSSINNNNLMSNNYFNIMNYNNNLIFINEYESNIESDMNLFYDN
jgi:hypothetical protein